MPPIMIVTRAGLHYNVSEPVPHQVNLLDIAYGLAAMPRHWGRTSAILSTAEYAVALSKALPTEYAMLGLLHQAPVAYLPQVGSPAQPPWPECPEGAGILWKRNLEAVQIYFGITLDQQDFDAAAVAIETLAVALLADEIEQLGLKPEQFPQASGIPGTGHKFKCMSAQAATILFLDRLLELTMPGSKAANDLEKALATIVRPANEPLQPPEPTVVADGIGEAATLEPAVPESVEAVVEAPTPEPPTKAPLTRRRLPESPPQPEPPPPATRKRLSS